MIVNKTYKIPSCDDVELGAKRESPLEFKLCYDDEKSVEALVFIVPGCGGDVDKGYRDHLSEFVAKEFNVATVNVDYHHVYNRLVTGARYYMDEFDQEILREKCREINLQLGGDLSSLKNFDKLNGVLSAISDYIENNKNNGTFPKDFVLNLSLTIDPIKNEYQNFGIMQAQDLINALLFIKANPPFKTAKDIKEIPVVMIGSSHGGYLSHMATKIAPWLIDGVIDNSSYAKYLMRIIGFGKELDYMRYCCSSNDQIFKHINFFISDKTLWTLKDDSKNRFLPAHEKIRYILNLDHVKTQSRYPKPIYVSYHYEKDDIAPISDKAKLYDEFAKLGFDAKLNIIKDQSQVDGKFIKTLDHGFDMSIKMLIGKELPKMLEKISVKEKQICENKSINYLSDDMEYKFFEAHDKINLEIKKSQEKMINKIYGIKSCDDAELGIARGSLLEFRLCYDDKRPVKAIVLIVPGLGGDADDNYKEHLAQSVADKFKVAVASVNYHCIGNRPQLGATAFMDETDINILKNKCEEIGFKIPNELRRLDDQEDVHKILLKVDDFISELKNKKIVAENFILDISATLRPTKDEYQNFGIMQAQDLINALLFIKANPPFKTAKDIKEIPVVMVGSSHGGYLSHMAAKIAPWLIDGVIDNSSYAKACWPLIGFGKEIDYVKFHGVARILYNNIKICFCDKTFWTMDKTSPYYFSQEREDIRNVLNLEHLKIQSLYPKPIYLSYHSVKDKEIAPADEKTRLYDDFKNLGYDATLHMIKNKSQIDGKFIKSLAHGMDMSIKTLVFKELPPMLEKISTDERRLWKDKSITYPSGDLKYVFFESENKINLNILRKQDESIEKRTYKIPSCDDAELGIKRESPLEFNLCFDREKSVEAIVFIVPGYGGDADSNYREHLAQFVAREFNVAVIGANYHCIGDRPQTGATVYFDDIDKSILQNECKKYGINPPSNPCKFDMQTLLDIDDSIDARKQNGEIEKDFWLKISLSLQPTKNEYQNFGIMQAQDLINALLFIKANPPFKTAKDIKEIPVVMIGSSHGGYLSHMATKIAPWLIDGVIDNSSYALIHWPFIGFGKEIDYTQYYSGRSTDCYHNIELYLSDKTFWTLDKSSPAYFSKSREYIREILMPEHLKIQSSYKKQIYVSYHYAYDDFYAPARDKKRLYETLRNLGYDATLNVIENQGQLDGRFLKKLTHGLDMSIKLLIVKELPPMLAKIASRKKQICKDKSIYYVSDDLEYKFYEANDRINLQIKKVGELSQI